MNDLAPTITDLKGKIEKLVNLHKQLKQENDRLTEENTGLKNTIEEQKLMIGSLQKENQEVVQTKNDEQNKTITDTKLKINELVQEIDSCIALLK
jgi:chromosome segregation ATPase